MAWLFLVFISLASALHAGEVTKKEVPAEPVEEEHFNHWTVVPTYTYSFFNKGRPSWQEEDVQIYYQINRQLGIGAEIDIMQRPPSGTDIYYSGLVSYYPWKFLELHGKLSFSPSPTFLAKQIYSGGFQYQVLPRVGLLLDYQRFNFVQGPIDQLNPGLTLGFTDDIALTLKYVRGWAFYELEYNYYSAALNIGLPGKRRVNLAFAYGTDPDSEIGSGGPVTSLTPAYTYSVYFTQPITKNLNIFAGVQYVYRLKKTGGELYQQLTPGVGLAWKF